MLHRKACVIPHEARLWRWEVVQFYEGLSAPWLSSVAAQSLWSRVSGTSEPGVVCWVMHLNI